MTEVVEIKKFWINARNTDILGAREQVMDCMDLLYKMEGKDMYLEKVLTGSVVAASYYQEGCHSCKSEGDQRGQGPHRGQFGL